MKKITFIVVLIFSSIFVNAQDIIYKSDGTEVKAKIIELTTVTIKYKKFEQLEGPTRNMLLSDVFMIIYEDGTKEVIKKSTVIATQPEKKESSVEMPKIQSINNSISLNQLGLNNSNSSNMQDLCFRGQQDASRYYTGYSSAATWTGAATILGGGLIGLIPAIACSSSKPAMSSLTFPDQELMKNSSYYSCYMQEAKRIKSRKVWTMFGIGIAVDIALILILTSSAQ